MRSFKNIATHFAVAIVMLLVVTPLVFCGALNLTAYATNGFNAWEYLALQDQFCTVIEAMGAFGAWLLAIFLFSASILVPFIDFPGSLKETA